MPSMWSLRSSCRQPRRIPGERRHASQPTHLVSATVQVRAALPRNASSPIPSPATASPVCIVHTHPLVPLSQATPSREGAGHGRWDLFGINGCVWAVQTGRTPAVRLCILGPAGARPPPAAPTYSTRYTPPQGASNYIKGPSKQYMVVRDYR